MKVRWKEMKVTCRMTESDVKEVKVTKSENESEMK